MKKIEKPDAKDFTERDCGEKSFNEVEKPDDIGVVPRLCPWFVFDHSYVSNLYPISSRDFLSVSGSVERTYNSSYQIGAEKISVSAAIVEVSLRTIFKEYNNWENDNERISVAATITDVDLRSIFQEYNRWPDNVDDERLEVSATITDVELNTILLDYDNWEEESLSVSANIVGVDLS